MGPSPGPPSLSAKYCTRLPPAPEAITSNAPLCCCQGNFLKPSFDHATVPSTGHHIDSRCLHVASVQPTILSLLCTHLNSTVQVVSLFPQRPPPPHFEPLILLFSQPRFSSHSAPQALPPAVSLLSQNPSFLHHAFPDPTEGHYHSAGDAPHSAP